MGTLIVIQIVLVSQAANIQKNAAVKFEKKYEKILEDWAKHCKLPEVRVSSSSKTRLECQAYKDLVGLGKNAIPLIMKSYKENKYDLGWVYAFALEDITGIKKIDGEFGFDSAELRKFWNEWWTEQQKKKK